MGNNDPKKIAIYGPLGAYPQPPPWYRFWQWPLYAKELRDAHEDTLSLLYSVLGTDSATVEMPTATYEGGKVLGLAHLIDLYITPNSGYFITMENA